MFIIHRSSFIVPFILIALGQIARAAEPVDAKLLAAFRAKCAELADTADKGDTITVAGKEGWLFLGSELRHVSVGKFWGDDAARVSRAAKPEQADPLPAILDFKSQLDRLGIELLLVPIPPKIVIYPEMLDDRVPAGEAGPPRLDADHQQFYAVLRKSGVKVLDLTPDFLAHRFDKDGAAYCKQDTHWSGQACVLAARRIAAELKNAPAPPLWLKELPNSSFSTETRQVEISGDLWQALRDNRPVPERLPLRFVGAKGDSGLTLVEPDRASPIVLLGDSHTLIFHAGGDMLAKGAGLPDQLAAEFGVPVDLIGVRGSGATPARINLLRQARAKPDYLSRKKLVIWCFSAREFTESAGWQKVPVVK